MTPADALASHRAFVGELGETILIHRDGVSPDTPALARPFGKPSLRMVGEIQQKSRRLVVLVDTLGALLPLTSNDSVILRGKTLAIGDIDDDTRRIAGTLIALELEVLG